LFTPRSRARNLAGTIGGVVATMLTAFLIAPTASATVRAVPAPWTPQIVSSNSIVRQLVQCGARMYAVGTFSSVSQGGRTYTRHNAFSFSAKNGALTGWRPNPNGEVNSVALSGNCATAYLGGKFTRVGARKVKNIAAVSTSTGRVATGFAHHASGMVDTIVLVNGGRDLLVGGNFSGINGAARAYYASLAPSTGKPNGYLHVTVAGQYPPNSGGTKVYNQQVSPSGTRLLFEGIFTSVAGQPRQQLAELNLTRRAATLNGFSNATLNSTNCTPNEQFYARAAAFSPDERTVYIATTGYNGSSPYCDAAVAFTNTPDASVTWINKTGGDSLYSIAASSTDVYIGGHERWANNPEGRDSCGTGCVSRPGIGDISAASGQATSWNPTRDRGLGADDLLLTGAGLWVASDTYYGSTRCAGRYHPGICFFPGA
jgi:hypothetical protein